MNILQAKNEIKKAVQAYFAKDEFGNYVIPQKRQRPIFLIGPPGIGKTDIMQQISSELGVALLTYSITHHSRQSLGGLPLIKDKSFDNKDYSVTSYTMSEIIASVYDKIEKTGIREGILFLDELNSASETISALLLEFLQYKKFSGCSIPEGWIVVTAGNPPEYNKSVHEFDYVTLDRLRTINVEADFDVWFKYATNAHIHPAVISFLETNQKYFYCVENTVSGKRFATARGWADLSDMIKIYEKGVVLCDDGSPAEVDVQLVSEYIQHENIANKFIDYYTLFKTYRHTYDVNAILAGKAPDSMKAQAKRAGFDVHIAICGLLLDSLFALTSRFSVEIGLFGDAYTSLKNINASLIDPRNTVEDKLNAEIARYQEILAKGKEASSISFSDVTEKNSVIAFLGRMKDEIVKMTSASEKEKYKHCADMLISRRDANNVLLKEINEKMLNAADFCREICKNDSELAYFMTGLITESTSSVFINFCSSQKQACKVYEKYGYIVRNTREEEKLIGKMLTDLDFKDL